MFNSYSCTFIQVIVISGLFTFNLGVTSRWCVLLLILIFWPTIMVHDRTHVSSTLRTCNDHLHILQCQWNFSSNNTSICIIWIHASLRIHKWILFPFVYRCFTEYVFVSIVEMSIIGFWPLLTGSFLLTYLFITI